MADVILVSMVKLNWCLLRLDLSSLMKRKIVGPMKCNCSRREDDKIRVQMNGKELQLSRIQESGMHRSRVDNSGKELINIITRSFA